MIKFADKKLFAHSLKIERVCRDLGGIEFRGSSTSSQSPFRANTNNNAFSISRSLNVFTDWGNPSIDGPGGYVRGDPIDFVRYKFGYDFVQAVNFLWDYYHGNSTAKPNIEKITVVEKVERNEKPDLTPEKLDEAYKIFLKLSSLDNRTMDALLERRLSKEEISYYGFKTFPKRVIKSELNRLLRESEISPEAVPGLYLRNGDTDASFNFHDAIILPVTTVDGFIAGLQLRFFNTTEGTSRYIWFSSNKFTYPKYQFDGKSPGTPLGFVDKEVKNTTTLFITEGLFKAIAINKCYGCPVISVQGVGNYAGIDKTLEKVLKKYPHINRILIAYDADFIGNISVTSHAVRLYQTMQTAFPNMKYQYVMWDEKYGKGFDDLIVSTGGWNVKNIVSTVDMEMFSEAFEQFRPIGMELFTDGRKDEIGPAFKKYLIH